MKKIGILRFPGTNCDRDIWQSIEYAGKTPEWLWHENLYCVENYDGLVVPGGFSYGDYLRCGALAAKSRVMNSVREAASKGIPILGICNGFQILCEAGLLPGILLRNENLRFIDEWSSLTLEQPNPYWGNIFVKGTRVQLPIAHGEGRYWSESDVLKEISDNEQIWWTYETNPNGSELNIAGVMNRRKNVAALMPHPERAISNWMGEQQGLSFFL